jgi:hypothetical protein
MRPMRLETVMIISLLYLKNEEQGHLPASSVWWYPFLPLRKIDVRFSLTSSSQASALMVVSLNLFPLLPRNNDLLDPVDSFWLLFAACQYLGGEPCPKASCSAMSGWLRDNKDGVIEVAVLLLDRRLKTELRLAG